MKMLQPKILHIFSCHCSAHLHLSIPIHLHVHSPFLLIVILVGVVKVIITALPPSCSKLSSPLFLRATLSVLIILMCAGELQIKIKLPPWRHRARLAAHRWGLGG